jgi:hypothetical protein
MIKIRAQTVAVESTSREATQSEPEVRPEPALNALMKEIGIAIEPKMNV